MPFYQKFGKRTIDIIFSLLVFLFLWPLFLLTTLLVKLDSSGPIIFKQKRAGKNGKVFTMYKFRTMINSAEELKKKYRRLNEADGPVFKINNDPRFTKIGKILSHAGIDELPQFFNIIKGEMSLVGPRPLPINEEAKIQLKYRLQRHQAKPGIACSWLVSGAHNLKFEQWMALDLKDSKKSGLLYDLNILFRTVTLSLKLTGKEIRGKNHFPFSK